MKQTKTTLRQTKHLDERHKTLRHETNKTKGKENKHNRDIFHKIFLCFPQKKRNAKQVRNNMMVNSGFNLSILPGKKKKKKKEKKNGNWANLK